MIEFTIDAPLGSLVTTPIGRVPGGFRVQIDWAGQGQADVTFAGTSRYGNPPCAPVLITGKIINGSDWALIRDDGVVSFDAKLTFEAEDPGKPAPAEPVKHVFDAVLSGTMYLGSAMKIMDESQLRRIAQPLEVQLPIRFETSIAAPVGASPELVKASKHAAVFAELSRRQFVAYGTISLKDGDLFAARLQVAAIEDILAERDKATQERNDAITERDNAVEARNDAIAERDQAIAERERGVGQRDQWNAEQVTCDDSSPSDPDPPAHSYFPTTADGDDGANPEVGNGNT
jgi:hypothetical protein